LTISPKNEQRYPIYKSESNRNIASIQQTRTKVDSMLSLQNNLEESNIHPELYELCSKKLLVCNFDTNVLSIEHNLTGLVNLGNTCYMNSILQCLLALKPFVASIQSCKFLKKPVSLAFLQLLDLIRVKPYGGAISPANLKRAVQTRARQFIGNE
jgi:ubiquitin C-terminal hydrolase